MRVILELASDFPTSSPIFSLLHFNEITQLFISLGQAIAYTFIVIVNKIPIL